MDWVWWAAWALIIVGVLVFALFVLYVLAMPPARSRPRWERIAKRIPLYETVEVDPCPWCQPPGSGNRKMPGVRALKIPPSEVDCGDCQGTGKAQVKLHKLSRDLRLREEQKWGIEKKDYEESDPINLRTEEKTDDEEN